MDQGEFRLRYSGGLFFTLLCGYVPLEFGPLGKAGGVVGEEVETGEDAVGLLDEDLQPAVA